MFIYLYRFHADNRSLTAKQFLRFNISDRAAAIILNTYLYEEGLITEIYRSRVIDKSLIRRWKASVYKENIDTF